MKNWKINNSDLSIKQFNVSLKRWLKDISLCVFFAIILTGFLYKAKKSRIASGEIQNEIYSLNNSSIDGAGKIDIWEVLKSGVLPFDFKNERIETVSE